MPKKKAASTIATSPDWAKVSVCVPSVSRRLQKVNRALLLVKAATAAITTPEDGIPIGESETEELGKAITELVGSAIDELYWITLLPDVVLRHRRRMTMKRKTSPLSAIATISLLRSCVTRCRQTPAAVRDEIRNLETD